MDESSAKIRERLSFYLLNQLKIRYHDNDYHCCHNGSPQIDMSPVSQPLPPALDRIIQRFQQISESKRRYEYLLHFAKRLPAFPEDQKIPENRVSGC